MKKLILCEGKTDAILLSYYLGKIKGWECGKAPNGLKIRVDENRGESAYWYQLEDNYLLICGVGGKDNFKEFFLTKILHPQIDSSAFSKIAVVIDRDDQSINDITMKIKGDLQPCIKSVVNNQWTKNYFQNSYGDSTEVKFLLNIVPPDQEGAMERLLLNSISEDEYDKKIADRSILFIDEIQPIAQKYISKNRLKSKACLAVTWAIQSPEKVFSFFDVQIKSVRWEESQILAQCFEKLIEI